MKIHEYQGKEILRNFGVPVPRGIPAFTVQEAVEAAQKLGGPVWVVKAQIHAGGRGKGGGVKVAKSVDDVKRLAGEILGMQLKTHQTGPEGQKVRRLYIEDGADIQKEYYVSWSPTARRRRSPSSPPAKAAWTSRKWRTPRPRRSSPCSSTRWPA
jgi:succinyl-CoA synthetase beta subunit